MRKEQNTDNRPRPGNTDLPRTMPAEAAASREDKISIIIPSAPDRSFNELVENLRRIKPPLVSLEIIVVKGTWPPLQRNLAIRKATGRLIFLFDDDVIIPAGVIEKVLAGFGDGDDADVIGGPNLTPPEDGFLSHCFGFAHGSYFAGASTAARYFPARHLKKVSESHLISCNLAFRAEMLKKNLFDPHVFPNEENELLARLQQQGSKLKYDPEFFVWHHRRKNLRSYLKQIFRWGAGRTLHVFSRPAHFNPVFLVPLAFLLYLASLAFFRPVWFLAPLCLYLLLDICFSISASIKGKSPAFFFIMLWLFPLTHITYALGLVWGAFAQTRRQKPLPSEKSFQTIEIDIT